VKGGCPACCGWSCCTHRWPGWNSKIDGSYIIPDTPRSVFDTTTLFEAKKMNWRCKTCMGMLSFYKVSTWKLLACSFHSTIEIIKSIS
jgi:hypothetical protein